MSFTKGFTTHDIVVLVEHEDAYHVNVALQRSRHRVLLATEGRQPQATLPQPPDWSAPMWTGTSYEGLRLVGDTCLDWTSTFEDETALGGSANSAAADWTDGRPYPCDALLPLTCFSTVEILFWGNFEGGDVEDWAPLP